MSNAAPGELPTLDVASAEPLLRRLELTVRNKLDGLLQGNYLGLVPGPGSEAGESRLYHPGDDVRRMDWPVTARTLVPHVRQTIADRELESWLVVDLSPSVDFGTAFTEKRELVLAAITAVVHLSSRGGNRVGAIVTTGEGSYRIPARSGRQHARYLIRKVAPTPRASSGGRATWHAAIEQLRRPPRRRGLVAVVSDFLDSSADGLNSAIVSANWERPLRALGGRHHVVGIEVVDPRELELPAAGLMTFVDPEIRRAGRGADLPAGYARSICRGRGRAAGRNRDDAPARRAAHLQLRTDRDWLTDVVRFVVAQRRALVGSGVR